MNFVQQLLSAISPLPDGDFVDRLNYCYTTTLLIVCSAFISGWSFVGQPIQCWFPAYYRGWWMEYALDYCYVQNTYFLSFTDVKPDNYFDIAAHIIPIPTNYTEREQRQLGYYQWVPFVLALQAFLFFLPVSLWRSMYSSSGFKVKAICETCSIKSNMEAGERSKNMDVIARFLIYDHDVTESLGGRIKSALEGRILVISYILTKLAYTLNALFQFLIVKWLLGTESIFWGWQVASDLVAGKEWPETGNFPRVTLCDFSVRVLGNLHRHSVQCVLMINMVRESISGDGPYEEVFQFNEKIFVLLWFWFGFVAAASLINFCYWLAAIWNARANSAFISSYLEKVDPSLRGISRRSQVRDFIDRTLRPDGLFIIRLIALNSGDLVTCQLIASLWRDYLQQHQTMTSLGGGEERRPPPYDEPVPLLLGNNRDK